MIRVSFLYRVVPGGRFDFDYYLGRHVPLARLLLDPLGLVRLEIDRGISSEERGSAPGYACVAHLLFESGEAFHRAMESVGDELAEDVANYTDLEIETLVGEIVG